MIHFRQKDSPRDRLALTIFFFDRFNAEDPLFVADVARRLAGAVRNGVRAMIVHASDDAAARAREAFAAGAAADESEVDLIERAIRMTNQSITRRMIDEGVSAVSIQGNHRGLFRLSDSGNVQTGRTEWLERAVSMGGVPVISLLAETENGKAGEVEPARALTTLVASLSAMWSITLVYFTTNRKSSLFAGDGSRLESVSTDRLPAFEEVPDVAAAVGGGTAATVIVTNSAGLEPDGGVTGTLIT